MTWRIVDKQTFTRTFHADTPAATARILQAMQAMLRDKAGRLRLAHLHQLADPEATARMLRALNGRFNDVGIEVRAWRILQIAPRTREEP